MQDAAPFLTGRERMTPVTARAARKDMAEALRERWLGTYMYYYYCGNLVSSEQQSQGVGVN